MKRSERTQNQEGFHLKFQVGNVAEGRGCVEGKILESYFKFEERRGVQTYRADKTA